jgi:Asp/Glu/hydantoin racemase
VIQSNTFDPGVKRAAGRAHSGDRAAARIAALCRQHLRSFGLIVPLETHMPHTMRMVQTYGMTAFVSGIKTVGLYDTGDLSGYHDIVIERTLAVGQELVQQGAQAIIPLGGKIYPYVVRPEELEPHLGVPVINTKAVGVSYAELMARTKMSHSIKAYPCPTGLDPEAVSQRSA